MTAHIVGIAAAWSVVIVIVSAVALHAFTRIKPIPKPAPPVTMSITELFEHRRRLFDARTPLGELEAPTLDPWPEDEAAEMLAAWRDQRAAVL